MAEFRSIHSKPFTLCVTIISTAFEEEDGGFFVEVRYSSRLRQAGGEKGLILIGFSLKHITMHFLACSVFVLRWTGPFSSLISQKRKNQDGLYRIVFWPAGG
ncbi:unnamed protein product [Ectocarpus sp. 8 AP-2014]